MKLSILVCTLPERKKWLDRLYGFLHPQLNSNHEVEILTDDRPKNIPTGTKRNDLIKCARGEYICFVDDDDRVPGDYIKSILNATVTNPDVITFNGYMTTDGHSRVNFVIKLGEDWVARNGLYYRYPNHLCPIKKSIASRVLFDNITYMEDYKWATRLRDMKLLKSEVHIDKDLYIYEYRTKK